MFRFVYKYNIFFRNVNAFMTKMLRRSDLIICFFGGKYGKRGVCKAADTPRKYRRRYIRMPPCAHTQPASSQPEMLLRAMPESRAAYDETSTLGRMGINGAQAVAAA